MRIHSVYFASNSFCSVIFHGKIQKNIIFSNLCVTFMIGFLSISSVNKHVTEQVH